MKIINRPLYINIIIRQLNNQPNQPNQLSLPKVEFLGFLKYLCRLITDCLIVYG